MSAYLYVLQLQHDCYYIGKTQRSPKVRLAEHKRGEGSAWTRLHPPIKFAVPVKRVPWEGPDEDLETKKWMKAHGVECVRGGSYTAVELSNEEIGLIRREWATETNACLRCNRTGHLVAQCYARTTVDGYRIIERGDNVDEDDEASVENADDESESYDVDSAGESGSDDDESGRQQKRPRRNAGDCFRCGRDSHWAADCYAKTDVNGNPL